MLGHSGPRSSLPVPSRHPRDQPEHPAPSINAPNGGGSADMGQARVIVLGVWPGRHRGDEDDRGRRTRTRSPRVRRRRMCGSKRGRGEKQRARATWCVCSYSVALPRGRSSPTRKLPGKRNGRPEPRTRFNFKSDCAVFLCLRVRGLRLRRGCRGRVGCELI